MTLIYPALPTPPLPATSYLAFWQGLATQDETTFIISSNEGLFEACLPEWGRMRGAFNTQHATHDFPLDLHTAKVLTKTRRSPYFQSLPPQWQELTTLAALLHDIDKEGGRAENRFKLKPDMAHPAKAVATVRKRLPTWGFSQQAVEWASLLVAHHQAFGRWIMRAEFMKIEPALAEAHQLANQLRSPVLLQALQALTEGDIRGVKAHDALFTSFAEEKLSAYGKMVYDAILPIESQHSDRLDGLFSQLQMRAESPSGWFFSTEMKVHRDIIPSTSLSAETIIATLPVSTLTDADARACDACELKNQASNRLFSVKLQRFEAVTEPCLRVGILANQIMAIERSAFPLISLEVQNPVMLGYL